MNIYILEVVISSPATSTVTSTITSTRKTEPPTTPEISSLITSAITQISTGKETSPKPKPSPYVPSSSIRDIFIITSDVTNLTQDITIMYKPTDVTNDSNYFSSSFKPFETSPHGSSSVTEFESATTSMFISSESAPSSQATSKKSFSSTTHKYKLCKKNYCKHFGVCLEEEGKERCICNYPFGGPDCGGSYWCSKGFGKSECPAGKCRFDFKTRIGYCDCAKDQYYNFLKKQCEYIDNCPFMDIKCTKPFEECKMGACVCIENFRRNDKQDCIPDFCPSNLNPCGENEICEDVLDEPGRVNCICKQGFTFDGKTCQKVNKCSVPGLLGCEQVCNSDTEACECYPGYTLQSNKKTCELTDESQKCEKDCGAGACIKVNESESCLCPPAYAAKGLTCVDRCTAEALPLGLCPDDQCIVDAKLGFKCKCHGKYAYHNDGITCRRKLMCSEAGGNNDCAGKNALCFEDFDSEYGYQCRCRKSQRFDTNDQCEDKCNVESFRKNCILRTATCELGECQCPPMLSFGRDGRCSEIAQASYLGYLPISKQFYTVPPSTEFSQNSDETEIINYNSIQKDVRDAMVTLLGKNYQSSYILSCEMKTLSYNCLIEVQFKADPLDQINILTDQSSCVGGTNNRCLMPPHLILDKSEATDGKFSPADPCKDVIIQRSCGKQRECTAVRRGTNNFVCSCGKGFSSVGVFSPFSDKRTIIHNCEGNKNVTFVLYALSHVTMFSTSAFFTRVTFSPYIDYH
nr:fibrillin-1-like [Parasteatoda tepidariorum]